MFFDDSLKGLKKELKTTGTDISFVKQWQKTYDKVKKQSAAIQIQYTNAKAELEAVMSCLVQMEKLLITVNEGTKDDSFEKGILLLAKDMKKYQGSFNLEFLISKEDKDFHLIYETILSLCAKDVSEKRNVLILQSEVENLMAITKEALEKEWPDFREMAYFYLGHTDSELSKMPHQEKIELVHKQYKSEFYNPMKQILEAALGSERADRIMEVEVWI